MIKYVSVKLNNDLDDENVVVLREEQVAEQVKHGRRVNLPNF